MLIYGENPFTEEVQGTFYNINESSISITICSTSQKVSSYGYTFSNVGEHRVMIKINDNNITSFKKMFCRCYNLIKIEGVPSKNINNFRSMFNCCKSLQNIDALKNWDVSNGVDFSFMFSGCESLQNIDALENWNISKGKNFEKMFEKCPNLTKKKIPPNLRKKNKIMGDNCIIF